MPLPQEAPLPWGPTDELEDDGIVFTIDVY